MKWYRNLSKKQIAVLALILANIIWGAASPIFKWSLTNIPLFTLAYLRFFGASLLLLPLIYNKNLRIEKKDWIYLVGLSLAGITTNITFFFYGLKNAPSINAPIIASTGPIFLILSSIIFLHEKPKVKTVIGTLISLVGVIVIIGRPLLENGFALSSVAGNLAFVVATLGAVIDVILLKEIAHKYRPIVITWWSFMIGSMTFFPLFVNESLNQNWLATLDIRGITGLVFGIILSSALAYGLFIWAVGEIAASEIGLFTYIDPVVATVIAIPLLGEVITPLFILGSFFVFAGIFVSEGRIHYHPFHKLRGLK